MENNKLNYLQSLKSGSKIHIKKENRGKFTRSAKAAGHSVQEHARAVLNDPNATPLQKKRANFARNAARWHHKHQMGGIVYETPDNKYTTQLSPTEEQTFRDWYARYASIHGFNPDPDTQDYDLRGYWKNNPVSWEAMLPGAHLPDTWKQPTHSTFSTESIYAKDMPRKAGKWVTDSLGPTPFTVERFDPPKSITIQDLADFTGGFETFSAVPYELKTSDGRKQILAGYGSANPEIIKLAREGKLTEEIARNEMVRRLQYDYNEWTRLLPEFKDLPEEVKYALVDTSYNGPGVAGTIRKSPKLISMIKSGIRDGKTLSKEMDHSKTEGGWLGVRSSARRAMAQGEYNWDYKSRDKHGRHVDYNQYKGPDDYKSSPYYNKYQQGGLVYKPFKSVFDQESTPDDSYEESVFDVLQDHTTPFVVEPVKPLSFEGRSYEASPIDNVQDPAGLGIYEQPYYKQEVTKGVTEFKNDKIDVGNMRELLDKFEEAGISVRVTSGVENRKTKSGKLSKHATADAIDITPVKGQTYAELREQIMNNPELLAYMRTNNIGIIDETDPLIKMKTGATGDHWHISRNENFALYGFKKMFGKS